MSSKMTENVEALPERVNRIEQKLDSLTVSVDKRFDDVSDAIVEQRQYTKFAFDRLRREMVERFDRVDARFDGVDARLDRVDARFDGVDARLDRMDARFDGVDARLDRMDARFDGVDARFDRMDARFDGVDARFDRMDARFDGVDKRFDRLEQKLDRALAPKRRRRPPKKR